MDLHGGKVYNYSIRNAPAQLRTAGSVSQRSVPVTSPSLSPAIDSDNLKRCTNCGETKPREAFNRNKTKRDGLDSGCKACKRAYRLANRERISGDKRAYAAANAERIVEYRREYYASNAERLKEKQRKYYVANSEQAAEYTREYRQKNAERIAERNREYYAANAERLAEQQRAYRQTDAGKATMLAGSHNRRARKAGAGGSHTADDLNAIRAAQTDGKGRLICWHCGNPIKGTPHLDHWVPLAKGGTNDAGNLHYMHARCNLAKNAKHPSELGRLI